MTSFSRRRPRRYGRIATAAAATLTIAALSACGPPSISPPSGETPDPGADTSIGLDQELHDILMSELDEPVLTFAAIWEDAPRIYFNASDPNTPLGIAPDLVEDLAVILGVEIEWINMQFPAQLPAVQAGTVDVLFPQISVTEERERGVVDLIPWWQASVSILVEKDNPKEFSSLSDTCGGTLGAAAGSTVVTAIEAVSQTACVSKGKAAITVQGYPGPGPAITALRAGVIDGWVSDQLSQDAAVEEFPDLLDVVPVTPEEYPPTLSGFAMSKDRPAITEAVLGAFRKLVEGGEYAALFAEYDLEKMALPLDQVVANPTTGTPIGERSE